MNIVWLLIGAVVGGAIAWVIGKAQAGQRMAVLEERARANEQLASDLAEKESESSRLQADIASLKTAAEMDRAQSQEKLALLEEAKEKLGKEFENLANRIFESRSAKLAGDHRERLDEVLKPFKDQLGEFRTRVDAIHTDEARQRASLLTEIQQLKALNNQISKEATDLTTALKGESKTRGNWGEMIVDKILELSGLIKGTGYESQQYLKDRFGGDKGKYPDFVVHLPEGRDVVVDAKVALVDYTKHCEAVTDEDRAQFLKEHVRAVRKHMTDLAGKKYDQLAGINPLEQVIMCVPNEPAYITAAQADVTLHDDAMKNGILIVGPNTLMLALQIVAQMWRTDAQNRNTQAIAERGQLLYDKFVGFVEDVEKVSRAIKAAGSACDDAQDKLSAGHGNLVGHAQKLVALGVKAKKSLPKDMVENAVAQLGEGSVTDQQDDSGAAQE